jgi:hypothetical protein
MTGQTVVCAVLLHNATAASACYRLAIFCVDSSAYHYSLLVLASMPAGTVILVLCATLSSTLIAHSVCNTSQSLQLLLMTSPHSL